MAPAAHNHPAVATDLAIARALTDLTEELLEAVAADLTDDRDEWPIAAVRTAPAPF